MQNPKFSLIVPCYNTANYLDACVDSLLRQSFSDFELLLVNDGSTDGTLASCRKWEAADGRIRVVDKKNGGLSDARNAGMAASRGQYLVFVDSDDFVEPGALEAFDGVIRPETEVVVTRLLDDIGTETLLRDPGMDAFFGTDTSLDQALTWVMRHSKNTWPAQGYVVSRKYVENHKLSFLVGYVHEDVDWTVRLFAKAKHVSICCLPWYHHRRERRGSITHSMNAKRILNVLEIAHGLIDGPVAAVKDYPERFRPMVTGRIMVSVFQTLVRYGQLATRAEKDAVVACAEKHAGIFRCQPKRKYRMFMFFVRLFGFRRVLDAYSLLPSGL
jgi:glycosyltransferase involved in cell wall biosynthesis